MKEHAYLSLSRMNVVLISKLDLFPADTQITRHYIMLLLLLLLLLLKARPLMPRKHLSQRLIVLTLNILHHRFSRPVSLIKKQRSLTEAVLISFGFTNSSPKTL